MFYEEEQIRNVLSCEKCNKRLDEPRVYINIFIILHKIFIKIKF